MRDKDQIEIRLLDIDCPELAQAFGRQAKKQTSDLCFGKSVTVKANGKDRYDRTLAHVILPNGKQLNRELVKAGLAWWYRKYSDDQSLGKLEADAKKSKRGLWTDVKPVAPWDWRAAQRAKSNVPISNIKVVPNGVSIIALLPNPKGTDAGGEQVTIAKAWGSSSVNLDGWKLIDKAGNVFPLAGKLDSKKPLIVTMTESTMPLNNNGDEVVLIDAEGVGRSRVSYVESQVRSGVTLRLELKPIEIFNLLAGTEWSGVIKAEEKTYVVKRIGIKITSGGTPQGVGDGENGRSLVLSFQSTDNPSQLWGGGGSLWIDERYYQNQLFANDLTWVEGNCKVRQFQDKQEFNANVWYTLNNGAVGDGPETEFPTQFTLTRDRLTGTVKSKGHPEISFDFKRMPKKKKAKDE